MSEKKIINGCGTALITPFHKNFEVDYVAYRALLKRQLTAGIDFLVPLGTTSESPCLEDDEKIKLLEITVEEVNGKVPIIAGAGSNSTKHVIKNLKLFEKFNLDGFLIVTPYYNKPTQTGLINHFKAVASETDKPIVMYNVPGRTGVNMTADTCLKLAEVQNIIAIKEASGNFAQMSEIIKYAPTHFNLFSGNDDETFALMALGGKGVISVASNIAPKEITKMTKAVLDGNLQEGRMLHHLLSPLFKNCFVESNPIPVKAGLSLLGLIENVLRPPLYASTETTSEIMRKTLRELKYVN
jgi:4-hydroxy-tetrahydrodipicolinate synthase